MVGIALATCAALLTACTAVDLEPIPIQVRVDGEYCTDDSATFGVPIRILLIIDVSQSMEINDPAGARGAAAASLVSELSSSADDVSFGFISFQTAAVPLTEGFERDPTVLATALNGLNEQHGMTNYLDALGAAEAMINQDIAKVAAELRAAEEAGEDTRFMRPWYFVVFLSDGIPRMPGGVTQDQDDILFAVEQLMGIPSEAMGITLHTAFLGAQEDAQRPQAETLLKKMAQAGAGAYFSFESGDEIDFSLFDFEIKRLFNLRNFLIYNRHAVFFNDTILADSDADGVSDLDEETRSLDPTARDTDGDGYGDGFEIRMAQDPADPELSCDAGARVDTDADNLTDCEEDRLGNVDRRTFDTDGDLFADGIEFYAGLNGGDPTDADLDPDFDGVESGVEVLHGTDPRNDDAMLHGKFGYRIETRDYFDERRGSTCVRFAVDNVTLTPTLATEDHPAGANDLVLDIIESPRDAADIRTLNRLVLRLNYSDYSFDDVVRLDGGDFEFETIATQDGNAQ